MTPHTGALIEGMNLVSLTPETLNLTKAAWLSAAEHSEHEAFWAEYHQLFAVIESGNSVGELDNRMNVPIYYAVESKGVVKALVQMVQSRRGLDTWVKMTDLYMCPDVERTLDSEQGTVDRLKIFTTALLGVFALTTKVERADTVKVYGRTEALVTFLRGMHDALSVIFSLGNMPGIEVSIEGRWLVFRTSRQPVQPR